jgi:uncharacterized protein (DUF2237 family)
MHVTGFFRRGCCLTAFGPFGRLCFCRPLCACAETSSARRDTGGGGFQESPAVRLMGIHDFLL